MKVFRCLRLGEAWLRASFLVVLGVTLVRAQVTEAEVAALAEFRSGITIDSTNALASWAKEDPCLFAGVACGPLRAGATGAVVDVVQIDLSNYNLTGTISPALVGMTGLQNLTLRNNFFYGPIPMGLENLTDLGLVDVSNNNLNGTVPVGLLARSDVKVLADNNPNLCDPRSPTSACEAIPKLGPIPVPHSDGDDGLSGGAIFGILVAILLVGGVIGGGVFYWFKVHRKKQRASLNFERFTGMGVSDDNPL